MLLVLGALKRLFRRRPIPPGSVGGSRIVFRGRSRAGVPVDHDIALTYSAVWACVRIISETLASVPWNVMQHRADGGRERKPDSRTDHLLTHQANPETTAFDFKQTLIAHALTWGNGYAAIDRGPNGNINWLWQLSPDRVTPGRMPDGELVYEVRPEKGDRVVLPAHNVLHFRGLGWDGIVGYSVIEMAAQSLGLGLATERFGAEFFGNGAHHCGILVHPNKLGDEAYTRLKESLVEGGGIAGAAWNRPLILEEGMEWKSLGIPPDNAQFLETRRFQVDEVGRWFRVPIFKLQEMKDAAIRANVEHSSIEFVTDTLLPWSVRYENEVNVKLLSGQTRQGVYLRINLDGLLRGDLKSRYEAYAVGRQWGWLSANNVRAMEDMNPIPAEQGGDEYMVAVNMQSGGAIVQGQPGKDGEPGPAGGKGDPGEAGARGADGEAGDRGLQGVAGEPGAIGPHGETGEIGPRGELGAVGLRGEIGTPGAPGVTGVDGPQGDAGADGLRGPSGSQGEAGEPGTDGTPGDRGEVGVCGSDGERGDTGADGPQGEPGALGDAGAAGAPGGRGEIGAQGERGDLGDRGPHGERGEDGRAYGPALRGVLGDAVRRICRTEAGLVEDAHRRHKKPAFAKWINDFYRKQPDRVEDKLMDVARFLVELAKGAPLDGRQNRMLRVLIGAYAADYCRQSEAELQGDVNIGEVVTRWRNGRVADELDTLMQRLTVPLLFGVLKDAATNAE